MFVSKKIAEDLRYLAKKSMDADLSVATLTILDALDSIGTESAEKSFIGTTFESIEALLENVIIPPKSEFDHINPSIQKSLENLLDRIKHNNWEDMEEKIKRTIHKIEMSQTKKTI